MNVLIFGATGGTGRACVEQALARNWRLTALLREPARLPVADPGLNIVTGDVLQARSLPGAFADGPFDACICALGVFHSRPSTELSAGTANVIAALERARLERVVLISSLGTAESRDQGSLFVRIFTRTILRHVLADKARQEAALRASSLDFTILRPPQLLDAPGGERRVIWWHDEPPRDTRPAWKIARADVATFALDAIEHHRHSRSAVQLCWAR